MNLFDLEVYEKKKCVPSAKRKKNGSKSKKCSLPSDNLTQAQLKKMGGKVMSYQLGKPVVWTEFKEMPVDIQERYLNGLVEKYNINASAAGKMFGVSGQSVVNIMAKNKLNVSMNKKPMEAKDRDAFYAFVNANSTAHKIVTFNKTETEQVTEPETETPQEEAVTPKVTQTFCMSNFELTMNGKFEKEIFYNSVCKMIPEGAEVTLEIKCSFKE